VCITKGKFQQAMADMIFVLGMVGAITGTILATEFNYNAAFSFFPLTCVFTHCVSGFACLYIGCANLFTMDKKTWLINTAILIVFSGCAWIGEIYLPADYMFLKSPDGTPFTILWNWFNGSKIFYPLSVIFVQLIFLALFYGAVNLIRFIVARKKQKVAVAETPINAPTNNDIK
jgi:uncharacterized membrane protein YwaF